MPSTKHCQAGFLFHGVDETRGWERERIVTKSDTTTSSGGSFVLFRLTTGCPDQYLTWRKGFFHGSPSFYVTNQSCSEKNRTSLLWTRTNLLACKSASDVEPRDDSASGRPTEDERGLPSLSTKPMLRKMLLAYITHTTPVPSFLAKQTSSPYFLPFPSLHSFHSLHPFHSFHSFHSFQLLLSTHTRLCLQQEKGLLLCVPSSTYKGCKQLYTTAMSCYVSTPQMLVLVE